MLLTPKELHELTDCARPSAQIEWLRSRSWVFDVGVTGRPKVDREEYERHMIGGKRQLSPLERWQSVVKRTDRRLGTQTYPLDFLRALPLAKDLSDAGLYFLWSGPLLLYVGVSDEVSARVRRHASNRDGRTRGKVIPFNRATALRMPNVFTKELETRYIECYRPRMNERDQ